jgi:CRISPR-associated protein Cmr4
MTAFKSYFIQALTPLHAGVGEGLGAVNLPTAREAVTGYPFVPGSTIKGVLRDLAERRMDEADRLTAAFGPPAERASEAHGGLVFSDALLLALPVRCLFGTFAWVSCPVVLRRLARDLAGTKGIGVIERAAKGLGAKAAWITRSSCLRSSASAPLFVHELRIAPEEILPEADGIAAWIAERVWPEDEGARAFFIARFLLLRDDPFGFLSRSATEIRSRVKIDDVTGTAAGSGSWTEEHLPSETLLHGLVLGRASGGKQQRRGAGDNLETLASLLVSKPLLRFGGKASVGMGRARMTLGGDVAEGEKGGR